MTKVFGMILKNILRTVLALSSAMAFVSHVQKNCTRNYMTKKFIKMYGPAKGRVPEIFFDLFKIRVVSISIWT
jgi:hypothetical protein